MSQEHLKIWGATHVGNKRTNNEDAYFFDATQGAMAVSDGMGGAAAGEIASGMSMQCFTKFLTSRQKTAEITTETTLPDLLGEMSHCVQQAHEEIVARQKKERDKRGMGCTFTGLLIADGKAFIAHAGDTRAYLLRGADKERVQLLTTDHNIGQLLSATTDMTPEQIKNHKSRHVLTNAVGVTAPLMVDTLSIDIMPGDIFLVCSDGLHEYFEDEQEFGRVIDSFSGEEACHEMVRIALERGGHDNITVVLAKFEESLPIVEGEVCDIREELATLSHVRTHLGLTRAEFLRFLSVGVTRSLSDGEKVLTPEQTGKGYLVLKGALKKDNSETIRKEGAFLGARTLASGVAPKRSWASVGAARVLVLERDSLRKLCLTQPVLGARILWGILELD